jgi:hypothetical protein
MEIGTSNKVGITPSVVQLVAIIKLVCSLRGGTSLKIIPLHVQVATVTNEPVKGNEKSVKEHVEPVDPSFTVLDSGVGLLGFIFVSLPLTPHQIGIG